MSLLYLKILIFKFLSLKVLGYKPILGVNNPTWLYGDKSVPGGLKILYFIPIPTLLNFTKYNKNITVKYICKL